MNNNCMYGYVRVSSKDQHEYRQLTAMREFGIQDDYLVIEKKSGRDFNRQKYQGLIKTLKLGDTLVVNSLDRLGRDYNGIIGQWRHITKDIGADIVVLDMPLLDTRKKDRDLTASFVADLVLQILSYVSEKEHGLIKQRQADGIAAAKARGVKFGRPPTQRPALYDELREKWQRKEISSRDAGQLLGVSHTTFLNWVHTHHESDK